jgi:hypothetical protein
VFKRILVHRPAKTNQRVDLGLVAETLLFYQHMDLIIDYGSLQGFVADVGMDSLVTLLERPEVTMTFMSNAAGVHSQRKGLLEHHGFRLMQLARPSGGSDLNNETRLRSALQRGNNDTPPTDEQLRRIVDVVHFAEIGADRRPEANLGRAIKDDLSDRDYTSRASSALIRSMIPGFDVPVDWRFEMVPITEEGFICVSNYDFGTLNQQHGALTRPYIAALLFDARMVLNLAAQYGTELMADPRIEAIIDVKLADILRKSRRSTQQIAALQSLTLNNGHAVREAINSGERSFGEFLELLDMASRFKEWLANVDPTVENLTHHYQNVCGNHWIDTLPGKTLRFGFFTGAGAIIEALGVPGATKIGLGLGAADTYLTDSIIKGWRPNQFIERTLQPFVNNEK